MRAVCNKCDKEVEIVYNGKKRILLDPSPRIFAVNWMVQPAGVPHRVDRLRGIGNGQVVQVTRWLGSIFKAWEKAQCGC